MFDEIDRTEQLVERLSRRTITPKTKAMIGMAKKLIEAYEQNNT